MASTGRIRVMGTPGHGGKLTGADLRVLLEDETGKQTLVPALSVTLTCAGRGEPVIVTVAMPAVLVDVDGLQLQAEAKVDPRGPESQWEAALGRRDGEPLADVPDVIATATAADEETELRAGDPVVMVSQPNAMGWFRGVLVGVAQVDWWTGHAPDMSARLTPGPYVAELRRLTRAEAAKALGIG